jgi:hypothetical protein
MGEAAHDRGDRGRGVGVVSRSTFVTAGHSRLWNGVASLAYAGNPCGGMAAWTPGSSPGVTIKEKGE